MKKLAAVLTIAVLLIFMPADVQAQGGNVLTWQKASALLRLNNNTIKDLAEAEQKSRKQFEDAVTEAAEIDTKGRTIYILDQEIRIAYDDATQMMMTQQKELYPEQMRFYWNVAQDTRKRTENSLTIGLRNLYLALCNADRNLKIKEMRYQLAESIHKQYQTMYEKGMVNEIDLLESEYDLLKAKTELDAARRNRENILRSFNLFLCMDIYTDYDAIEPESDYYTRLRDYDYYLDRAFDFRAEIRQAEKQLELLEKKKEIMERFPLSMNTVSIRNEYSNLLMDIEIQKARLEQARLDVEVQLKEAYAEASAAVRNTENMKKLLEIQESNINKIRQMYEKGLISKTMLDQAEISFLEFRGSYDMALFDCNTKLLRLIYISGTGM